MIGCTPRACEERLKKLRKLAKGCPLEDSGETDGEPGRGSKNVNRKRRKRRTEEERGVERGDNKGREPLEDIQEKEESTAATATDISAVKENAASKAGVRNQNLHGEHTEFIPVLLPASPTKPDPSTPPPTHHRSRNGDK